MKKCFAFILSLMLFYLFFGISNNNVESIQDLNKEKMIKKNIAIYTDNLENGKYEKILPLYNLAGDAKYTYYEFIGGGYAIFYNNTGEMLEQSKTGKIDFYSDINYYFGPFNYISKIGNNYYDIYRNKAINDFENEYIELSDKIDDLFNEKEAKIENSYNSNCDMKKNAIRCIGENPVYNGYDLIDGLEFDFNYATLIANYKYFLSNPWIAYNSAGSGLCGPVATQLLLSYLNYYVDRRIVPDKYLNGYDYILEEVNDESKNPNYCDNPNDMSSEVIGSSSDLDNQVSFISKLRSLMMNQNSTSTNIGKLEEGLTNYFLEESINNCVITTSLETNTDILFMGIKNYIDNDTPLVLGTIDGTPVYDAHFAVCYGYTEFYVPLYNYTYKGYVIHDGWFNAVRSTEEWINSMWCDCYLAISINHAHTYNTRELIQNSSTYEYKCSCGHRTAYVIDYDYETSSKRIIEKNIIQDGYKNRITELYIKPNSTTNRIITTLGEDDTIIKLKSANGTLITSDDDSGYGYNAMINESLTANTWYKLQIILNEYVDEDDMEDPISILLLMFCSNREQTDEFSDFDILNGSKTNYLERNESMVFISIPPSTGNYTFTTDYSDSNIVDTYMYLYNPKDISDKAYNDDGAGNSQATITKNLIYGEIYVIIVTAYNPLSQNGVVSLLLNNDRAQLPNNVLSQRIMRATAYPSSTSGTYIDKYGNSAYKVTDSIMTASSQPKLILDFVNLGINLPTLQNSPYQTVILCIQFSVYEINDGYQKIYIRDQYGNNYVNPITNMEHGSGYKEEKYQTYLFYAEIPKSSIGNTYLEINFSASGSDNDDWVFVNPVVRAGYSTQSASNSSILVFNGLSIKDF